MALYQIQAVEPNVEHFEEVNYEEVIAQRYASNFHHRAVLVERKIEITTDEGHSIEEIFNYNRWSYFLHSHGQAAVELVKEFYSLVPQNLKSYEYQFEFTLCGVTTVFLDDLLADIFELPRIDSQDF